jgi:hypothetical protein
VQDPYLNSVLEAIASDALDTESPRLISVDELRAAGALDVPAAWRKSLGKEPDLFGELLGHDDPSPTEPCAVEVDTSDEASSDKGVRPQADEAE